MADKPETIKCFWVLAIHHLGRRLLSRRPGGEDDAQEALVKILTKEDAIEEEKKIAFLYLVLASSMLTREARHAVVAYAADVTHADVVAEKGSAGALLGRSFFEATKAMEEFCAKARSGEDH